MTRWLWLTLLAVLTACGTPDPPVTDGTVDVSAWDPQGDGPIRLDGIWSFHDDRLLEPADIATAPGRSTLDTRQPWNTQPGGGPQRGAFGMGTYSLEITGLDPDGLPLALRIPGSLNPYKAFWAADGATGAPPVLEMGLVHPTDPIPHSVNLVSPVPRASTATLVVQVSNQHWPRGGMYRPIWLGDADMLARHQLRFWFTNFIALGGVLMMGLYHLWLYTYRNRDRASLWFALFCLLQVPFWLAYLAALQPLLLDGVKLRNHLLVLYIVFVGSYLTPAFFVAFLREAFPEEVSVRFTRLIWLITGSLTVACLLLGFPASGHLNKVYTALVLPSVLWVLVVLGRSITARRRGARYAAVGFAVLGTTIVHDILQTVGLVSLGLEWTPFGLLAFVAAQSLILAGRFADAQSQAEHLSEHLRAEVEAQTVALQRRTDEALAATHELQRVNVQLRSVDAQKTAFFRSVSHELRTPLTLILNPLDHLAAASPADRDLALAQRNARRLLRLVNQLLDLQRLEAVGRRAAAENIDLARFARALEGYVAAACEHRGIAFELTSPDTAVRVAATSDSLEKIAFNFLANALKYTPDGGSITLAVASDGDHARLVVRDTGPGISAADQERLFEVFTRLEDGTVRGHEGTGLGLALARRLAEELGGDVGIDSEQGAGAAFWLRLPLVTATEHDTAEVSIDGSRWALAPDLEPSEPTATGVGDSVLVIDDLPDMRELLTRSLSTAGYRVSAVESGEAGLAFLRSRPVELVITDWMMPGMSGPEVIEAIRADAATAGTPVVLLTARSDESSRRAGVEVGADVFLGKPFDERELHSVVRNLLSLKAHERALARAYAELEATSARELEHAGSLLAEADKLGALGRLVADAGHEMSNPVTRVALASDEQADLLEQHEAALLRVLGDDPSASTPLLEDLDTLRELIAETRTAVDRLRDVSGALREQAETDDSGAVPLIDVLDSALTLLASRTRRIDVTRHHPEPLSIAIDRSVIGQVLSHLITDAADAVASLEGRRGAIHITAAAASRGGVAGAEIVVADNGDGVRDEGREASRRALESCGGSLEIGPAELGGTRAVVWVPSGETVDS